MVEPIHIMLQQNEKLGFISSALSFILGIASLKPDVAWDVCVGPVVDV
jgi:AP-2 complex subunit alpha